MRTDSAYLSEIQTTKGLTDPEEQNSLETKGNSATDKQLETLFPPCQLVESISPAQLSNYPNTLLRQPQSITEQTWTLNLATKSQPSIPRETTTHTDHIIRST